MGLSRYSCRTQVEHKNFRQLQVRGGFVKKIQVRQRWVRYCGRGSHPRVELELLADAHGALVRKQSRHLLWL